MKTALIAQFQEGHHAQEMKALLEELSKMIQKEKPMDASASEAHQFVMQPQLFMPDVMSAEFAETFRGSRAMIMRRQSIYLPYIENSGLGTAATPIIDLGCGRGEFLELMKSHGKTAQGLETNHVFVSQCRAAGLHVLEQDAMAYLMGQPGASVGCVVALHLIEHLTITSMLALIQEVYRVLAPGGLLIIETPNPENLQVGACLFHLDPTHRTLLPPIVTKHLLEAMGFTQPKTLRLHPYPEDKIPQGLKEENLSELVRLLYGPRDYAIITTKSDEQAPKRNPHPDTP